MKPSLISPTLFATKNCRRMTPLDDGSMAQKLPIISRTISEHRPGRWSAMYDEKLLRMADHRRDRKEEEVIAHEVEKVKAVEVKPPRRLQTLVIEHLE
jgi:hypothetical protein